MKLKDYKKLTNVGAEKKAERDLKTSLHKYVCLRDLEKLDSGAIVGKCISCGKVYQAVLYYDKSIMNGREWHAGHLFKSHQYKSVRFDERNINGQDSHCNRRKHGDEANYTENLIKKIGQKEYDKLVIRKNKIVNFNIIEIHNLTKYYKHKAKLEAEKLGIKI